MAELKGGAEVRLTELTKSYAGNPPSVDGVSLVIRPGEFVTFLGPSGSGKTTTLNMIAGFVTPSRGSIEVDGAELAGRPAHRRNLGMVFQQYALFPHMSVFKNVAFPLEQRRVPKAEIRARVMAALGRVRLDGMAERPPASLSGGQQQRVALARAIVFEPPVLLMDEPFGALDKALREQLQAEVTTLHRDLGTTFIFVTHDQDEAMAMSDRIAVFNDGRIEQVGPPRDLYEKPATEFVARFLGESNIFRAEAGNGSSGIRISGQVVALPSQASASGRDALMVRPERIRLLRPDVAVPDELNRLHGVIDHVTYVGASVRVVVRLADGRSLLARTVPDPAITVGSQVRATWHPDDAALVESDAS